MAGILATVRPWPEEPPFVFEAYRGSDIKDIPTPTELVIGRFIQEGFALIVGESGVGKTFLALSLALSLTTNQESWLGADIPRQRRVLYAIPEGFGFLKFRIYAWLQWAKAQGLVEDEEEIPNGLTLMRDSLDLTQTAKVNAFIRQFSGHHNHPHVVLLDTWQRHGGPEFGEDPMRMALENIGRIQRECQTAVIAIHHTPKSGTPTPRGHGALDAAADTVMICKAEKEGHISARFEQRDLEPSTMSFQRATIKLEGHDYVDPVTGQPRETCVAIPVGDGSAPQRGSARQHIKQAIARAKNAGHSGGHSFEELRAALPDILPDTLRRTLKRNTPPEGKEFTKDNDRYSLAGA